MRMTNEEFQAEVFRRSAAYQQKRTKRIRFMTGATAFAGCLLLTVAVLPHLTNSMHLNKASEAFREQEKQNAETVDSCEEAAADNAEESFAADAPSDVRKDDRDQLSVSNHDITAGEPFAQNSSVEDSSEDSYVDSSAEEGVFAEKTVEELLAYYGLDALPEQIGSMKLVTDRSKGWYHSVEKLGLTVSEYDADRVLGDHNTWFYLSWEPMQNVYLTLFRSNYGDSPAEYSYPDDDPERNVEYAVFAVDGIGVSLETGFSTHEQTEQIVAEITDYLKAHRIDG